MSKKRRRKAKPIAPTTFPLSLGWVVSDAFAPRLLFPMIGLVMLIALGPQTSQPDIAAVAAIVLGAILVVVIAINALISAVERRIGHPNR